MCFNELEAFQSILSTKKQSMAVKRAYRRSITVNTSSSGDGKDRGSVPENSPGLGRMMSIEQSEFEKESLVRQSSLLQSKAYVENQGRLYQTKSERQYKLMSIFDKTQ